MSEKTMVDHERMEDIAMKFEAEAITKILAETRQKVSDMQSEWIGMRECSLCKRR